MRWSSTRWRWCAAIPANAGLLPFSDLYCCCGRLNFAAADSPCATDCFGASSMGALRAAELHTFGMRGVGEIFERYRDGVLEDDDEVAVSHASADHAYRELSVAMVNLRELQRDVQASRAVYEAFLVRARETGAQEHLDTKNIQVISKADVPLNRTWPPSSLILALGAIVFGIGAGSGLVMLRDSGLVRRLPDQAPRRHLLSQLSLGDWGWVQVGNFVLAGLLNLLYAWGLWRSLHPGRAGTWGPLEGDKLIESDGRQWRTL